MSKSKLFNEKTASEAKNSGKSGIDASVEHWQRIVNYVMFTNKNKINWSLLSNHISIFYCGLCGDHPNDCEHCPLGKINYKDVQRWNCGCGDDTKWDRVYEAIHNKDLKKARVAAEEMLDILIGIQAASK